jgi:hypothetical protein
MTTPAGASPPARSRCFAYLGHADSDGGLTEGAKDKSRASSEGR